MLPFGTKEIYNLCEIVRTPLGGAGGRQMGGASKKLEEKKNAR